MPNLLLNRNTTYKIVTNFGRKHVLLYYYLYHVMGQENGSKEK